MGKLTFGRKVGMGFAIAILALIVIAVAGYRASVALIANDQRVAHTQGVRRQIQQLVNDITNAETGQRGFVITGKDEFLTPYTNGLADLDRDYQELRKMVSDTPAQLERLDRLRTQLDEKTSEMKKPIELRATSLESAVAFVSNGQGKAAMDRIRTIFKELDDTEANVLEARRVEAEASTNTATSVILYGSIVAIIVTLIVAVLLVTSLTKQIGGSVRDLQSSSAELQASANQQASGATESASAMAEIATTISELMATSRQIAESSQRVAQIATETAGAARAGTQNAKRTSEATVAVRRQVDQIVGHMLDLGKKAQQVGTVLDIVSELAEQTNILAINATIEAAGAGEAGRRFGVVATEIRTLADRVGASTKEIRGLIDDVRGAVNTTVMATEAGSKAVDASSSTVSDMATTFTQIGNLVGTTNDAAREIELSTKQQATAVEQVNIAITNVAQATREAEASAMQTQQTASQLSKLSTDLIQIVQAA